MKATLPPFTHIVRHPYGHRALAYSRSACETRFSQSVVERLVSELVRNSQSVSQSVVERLVSELVRNSQSVSERLVSELVGELVS